MWVIANPDPNPNPNLTLTLTLTHVFPGYRPRRPLHCICSLVITPQVGHCQSKKHDFVLAPASIEAKITQREPKEVLGLGLGLDSP